MRNGSMMRPGIVPSFEWALVVGAPAALALVELVHPRFDDLLKVDLDTWPSGRDIRERCDHEWANGDGRLRRVAVGACEARRPHGGGQVRVLCCSARGCRENSIQRVVVDGLIPLVGSATTVVAMIWVTMRIDAGLAKGLKPGVDPEATPACVNSCIAQVLHFGDAEDPNSNISQLLAENHHFRMHEELGTEPGFYYLWDKA